MRWIIAALGIVAGLAIIALTAELSFLFWYERGALLDGKLALPYGAFGAVFEAVKALAPFLFFAHWRARAFIPAIMAGLILLAAVGVSFSSATGLAAHMRLKQSAAAAQVGQAVTVARGEIELLEVRRTALGAPRSPGEVEAEIASALATPIAGSGTRMVTLSAATADCQARITRATGAACARIGELRVELARARERERLDGRIAELRGRIAQLAVQAKSERIEDDYQARFFADGLQALGFAGVSQYGVQAGLIYLMASALEFCAGWLIYLSVGYFRIEGQGSAATGEMARFCYERLMPGPGRLTLDALVAAYQGWCREQRLQPLPRGQAVQEFEQLAAEAGIPRQGEAYWGVRVNPA